MRVTALSDGSSGTAVLAWSMNHMLLHHAVSITEHWIACEESKVNQKAWGGSGRGLFKDIEPTQKKYKNWFVLANSMTVGSEKDGNDYETRKFGNYKTIWKFTVECETFSV